jgi:deoxyribodipyrimidine photo-lyase
MGGIMRTLIMLFTRDLRVHDNPALAAAVRNADQVVPMFVLDPRIAVGINRQRFLSECLNDLRSALRDRGSDLLIRHGDPVAEVIRVAGELDATGVAMTRDVSEFAARRERRMDRECIRHRIKLASFDGVTVVPPGDLVPSTGGALYRVFTPYFRAWQARRWRAAAPTPRKIASPPLPGGMDIPAHRPSPHWTGGESEALRRLANWKRRGDSYADGHDDLAGDRTSRLSPYLHFGCLSPVRLVTSGMPEEYVRQVCWRDFYHQLLASFPKLATTNFRESAADRWTSDDAALERWKHGDTGVDIVDAGMRQLLEEGWMHNRARLITASYLTKTLGIDWRAGADWFMEHLVDADVANNYGNWQWVAGTGTDTKPYRKFSPARQAERFDPEHRYRDRYLT